MNAMQRREAAGRILVAVAIAALCLLWPTLGTAVVAGIGAAAGLGTKRGA